MLDYFKSISLLLLADSFISLRHSDLVTSAQFLLIHLSINWFCYCSSQKSAPWLKGKGISRFGMRRDKKSFHSASVQEYESLPHEYLNSSIHCDTFLQCEPLYDGVMACPMPPTLFREFLGWSFLSRSHSWMSCKATFAVRFTEKTK